MNENSKAKENSVLQASQVFKSIEHAGSNLDILYDISMDISAGSTVSMTGPSGSGKTTLLGILAGLDLPSSGSITLLGQAISTMDEDERAKLRNGRVGFVFQSFHLLPNLTALENISLALEVISGSQNIKEQSVQSLESVGLSNRASHLPSQLSGGEQQRVALARSMVVNPAILFADEPTGNLDYQTSMQIVDLMFSLVEQRGSTLILATHDHQLAGRCDVEYRIEAGHLV
ncbi:MAG: ABC transporter ATP-binding protein [Gammaproteobacteria bacterium]|nr:ABC transporter ATP-binding protein [Gammaproteobacteria bacterium]MCY4219463.1 ABC transporter ATP-binding protein [Gammaproteobacteria bacterium]MCY4275337.1 ABC transporter ATP-binding protein [Gammaproteobacteria bacterium]